MTIEEIICYVEELLDENIARALNWRENLEDRIKILVLDTKIETLRDAVKLAGGK